MNFSLNKKLILLVIAGLSLATVNAQVQLGVKAGANFSTFTGSDASDGGFSTLVSFHGGAIVKIPVNDMFSVQPEVVFSIQGAKSSDGSGNSGTLSADYINIPILATYTLPAGVFFQAGPQIGILASAKAKSGGVSVDAKSLFKSTDFGVAFGAGYLTSMNLGFNVRYNLGLANIESSSSGGSGTVKNSVIQVGVFYMFGDSGAKK